MENPHPPLASPDDPPQDMPSSSQAGNTERAAVGERSEQQASETRTEETEGNPQANGSLQGKALQSLVSTLVNDKHLTEINRHQASTLRQLVHIRQGLAAINKQSLDAYNESAADFIKAARLAGQIKQNLDDITRRLASLKALADRGPPQSPLEPNE